jgi:flagellin
MALSVNNNLMALMAANNLTRTYNALSSSINRLSSGLRINGAADDAAGLAVRELMRSDIAVLQQGVRNANDAISMLQTMDGAAGVIDEKLIRMKELAEQASTGTYSDQQRQIMNDEFEAMRAEIDRIAQATDFNGIKMLNGGSGGTAATVQALEVAENLNAVADTAAFVSAFSNYSSGESLVITFTDHNGNTTTSSYTLSDSDTIADIVTWLNTAGANAVISGATASWTMHQGLTITDDASGTSQMSVNFLGGATYNFTTQTAGADATDGALKIHFGTGNDSAEDYYYAYNQDMTGTGLGIDTLNISTQHSAQAALEVIDDAILAKDTGRAHFGAVINRLQNTATNLTVQAENIQAAESQISDVDVAFEMTQFMNNQIKAQAAVAMLSQANMVPQMAMTLLGG